MTIPIYDDPTEWNIVDAASDPKPNEWHPSNGPARRLCRCLEGVRDLVEALEHVLSVHNRSKKRRRMRSVITPLHNLCACTVDLLNSIQSDNALVDGLPENCGKDLAKIVAFLKASVPFEGSGKLALLRNKVAAHYDRDMQPMELRAINLSVDLTEIAEWISINIFVLCDALKLKAYTWSGTGYSKDSQMIMCSEPLMTDFRVEAGRVVGINGCFVSKSPRWEVYHGLRSLWKKSDELFERPSVWRIREFIEDDPGCHWSKVLQDGDRSRSKAS